MRPSAQSMHSGSLCMLHALERSRGSILHAVQASSLAYQTEWLVQPCQGPMCGVCGAQEAACGCAGIFSAPVALPLYAHAFEQAGALDKLEAFASFNGPDFYGLPRNSDTVTLRKEPWEVPATYPYGDTTIVPMWAGQRLEWQVEEGTV